MVNLDKVFKGLQYMAAALLILTVLFIAFTEGFKLKQKIEFYDSFMKICMKETDELSCKSKLLLGGKIVIEPMPSSAFNPTEKGK